jgi:CubicO group peptidase (beta-lactamase class C family)
MKKFVGVIALYSTLSVSVWGQVPDVPTGPSKEGSEQILPDKLSSGVHELTATDVEAFLGGLVPLQLLQEDIAGATVAVVRDGRLLFARGYGYADYENKRPVSAEETLFRPGSVSKLFVWTAVMQLVEQGKLDLDRDVNDYLDFKIPSAFGAPITMKNLLTHTPGFEEQVKDLFSAGDASPDLGGYVRTHVPERIFPPGTTPAYSNYGTSLAGYIVERVSGRPLADYLDENIFKPLGMARSTFAQPLPPALAPHMSNGYRLASDGPQPFEVVGAWPAGSLSSSATDMARFIIAHLQGGQLGDARILRAETAHLMHSRLFALDPAANAMAHGFYEESRNGHRIIGHAGDTMYFHSDLHLVQDAGLGFFVSYNSGGRGLSSPRTALWEAFLDRYLPYTLPSEPTLASAKDDAKAVSGSYTLSRRSETSFLKAAYLVQGITVSPAEDGAIEVSQLEGPNGKPKRWREVAPMVFRDVRGQETLIFKQDGNGRMQMILPFPFFVGQRVGLWESHRVLVPIIGLSLLIMLLTLVLWPVAALVRRRYGHRLDLTAAERRLRLAVRIVCALNILFIVAIFSLALYGFEHLWVFSDQGNVWFYLIQVIGVVGTIGTLVVLYDAIRSWTTKRKGVWAKLHAFVLALACLGFVWFVLAGNLLRFSGNY